MGLSSVYQIDGIKGKIAPNFFGKSFTFYALPFEVLLALLFVPKCP